MKNRILVDCDHGLTRVAVLEEGDLAEYYVEREGRCCMVGNVYVGRVQNVLPGMQAAFIDIGTDKNAFLYLGDEQADRSDYAFGEGSQVPQMVKVRPGQELMVQVVKEPEGQKGPRVTTHVTVPGRLAVLATAGSYIGISRRIEDEEERERLRAAAEAVCPEGMGLILRTAAVGTAQEELEDEVRFLKAEWDVIARKGKHASAPKRIHREDTLLLRTIRDLFTSCTEEMLIADEKLYQSAFEHIEARSPELLDRAKFYQGPVSLFERHGVEDKADKALARKVWLKSGGYLIFDTTEALTVIDVNSGKFVGKKDLQDTVFRVNIEAASEIARQLRLRDVGGIIIIDFIDMEDTPRREELVETLRAKLKCDRNKTNVVGLTGLGLVEMTRKKTRACLSRAVQKPCPCCGGGGMVFSPDQIARKALREISLKRQSGDEQPYRLEASQDVIQAFERLGGERNVAFITRPAPPSDDYALHAVIGES